MPKKPISRAEYVAVLTRTKLYRQDADRTYSVLKLILERLDTLIELWKEAEKRAEPGTP
ncbi:MAG: hypothetical protein L3K18_09595 [Thermoplasmata archaeon]|nr:hypothetical protein [Thermoplasmata archaeon]